MTMSREYVKKKFLTANVKGRTVRLDMTFNDISSAQERVLIAYKTLSEKHRECPTASEVAAHLGTTTRSVFFHLALLEKKGYVIRRPGRRNIVLTEKAS